MGCCNTKPQEKPVAVTAPIISENQNNRAPSKSFGTVEKPIEKQELMTNKTENSDTKETKSSTNTTQISPLHENQSPLPERSPRPSNDIPQAIPFSTPTKDVRDSIDVDQPFTRDSMRRTPPPPPPPRPVSMAPEKTNVIAPSPTVESSSMTPENPSHAPVVSPPIKPVPSSDGPAMSPQEVPNIPQSSELMEAPTTPPPMVPIHQPETPAMPTPPPSKPSPPVEPPTQANVPSMTSPVTASPQHAHPEVRRSISPTTFKSPSKEEAKSTPEKRDTSPIQEQIPRPPLQSRPSAQLLPRSSVTEGDPSRATFSSNPTVKLLKQKSITMNFKPVDEPKDGINHITKQASIKDKNSKK